MLGEEQELLQAGEEQGEALAPADLSGDVGRVSLAQGGQGPEAARPDLALAAEGLRARDQ